MLSHVYSESSIVLLIQSVSLIGIFVEIYLIDGLVKNIKNSDGEYKSDPRSSRFLSFIEIFYSLEGNGEASQDGLLSEREDSDYEEELELDFESALPDEEVHDIESNILQGSLNLRIHRRSESSMGSGRGNGSCGSPSFSCQNENAAYQVKI